MFQIGAKQTHTHCITFSIIIGVLNNNQQLYQKWTEQQQYFLELIKFYYSFIAGVKNIKTENTFYLLNSILDFEMVVFHFQMLSYHMSIRSEYLSLKAKNYWTKNKHQWTKISKYLKKTISAKNYWTRCQNIRTRITHLDKRYIFWTRSNNYWTAIFRTADTLRISGHRRRNSGTAVINK
ncbi:Hypothetical_protein [Hexamita inflata]|uniref:Hypothetical_protein n=1 Tax=Hexamita inflata TaxID=28002 RepID=A0AA86U0I0_9EUKA|nr:Hypothetical protein HINF_LOCUS23249 [Hexamita inflata]